MSYLLTKILTYIFGRDSSNKDLPVFQNLPVQLLSSPPSRLDANRSDSSSLQTNLETLTSTGMSRSQHRRWFGNPYSDYEAGKDSSVNLESVRSMAITKADECLSKGTRSGSGGVYVGAIGCSYMVIHIFDKLSESEKRRMLPAAMNAYHSQHAYFNQISSTKSDKVSFLLGKGGMYAVGAVLGELAGNPQLTSECLHHYVSYAALCTPLDYVDFGGDELFVGRCGYLCGALWLQQKLGYQPVPKDHLSQIWKTIVSSGQLLAKELKSPSPLMYSYYDTQYLGAAHGLSSILQILLSFPVFLQEYPEDARLIRNTIDYYLTLQDNSGNFPCAMDELGSNQRRPDEMLVHWCHGAPGAIFLFSKAYLVYDDTKYLAAAVKCADLIWTKGLLRKGPGICHGVTGNAYAFLLINQLLKGADPKYVYRAGKFAEFLDTQQFRRESRVPDSPFSLYEGWAGAVCFLMDLLQPDTAEFPFFNINVNYSG